MREVKFTMLTLTLEVLQVLEVMMKIIDNSVS